MKFETRNLRILRGRLLSGLPDQYQLFPLKNQRFISASFTEAEK
ncbi:Uncharacterized protein dnm_040980 [Desulfonema magnum]|uniref:Uncharacterized protein n=1 Tax=Desulfonema magnum TaxID=45655 RepID=A0A975BM80_9BACT|nr:Uncharacterized protein dnm_040980 [Desulfonema magnum]